jgi:RHS repeat-associated protein
MIAAFAAILCVVTTGVVVPAYATAATAKPPKPNPGRAVNDVKPTRYRFAAPKDDAKAGARPTAVNWPKASTAKLTLSSGKRSVAAKGSPSPVWASPVVENGRYSGPAEVETRVLGQEISERAGLNGVMMSVNGADAARGRVRVGLNYSGFAEAYGGNYGSRLRLVQLPACAATTPGRQDCRTAAPVESTNDTVADTVSAEVTLAANSSMVLAAVAGSGEDGGAAGTYAVSDLKPSGSWGGGGSNGSFTYSYPIAVPPAPSGLVPSVGLSYDSGGVDGQTSSTQSQSSWVGDGWGTPQSYIEQTFVSCRDDPQGKVSPKKTSDFCYAGPLLTMALNGATTTLIWDATKKIWKPESDSGEVVVRETNTGNGSGTHDTSYWSVTTRDGANYQFGRNQLPGWTSGKPTTHSVDTVPVYSPQSGDPCFDAAGFAKSVCTMARRWNLDYVTDVHGNAMSYYYTQDSNYYARNEASVMDSYVRDSYLARIDYGFRAGGAYGTVPNQVVFNTDARCVTGTCKPLNDSTKANWQDVPYDLVCAKGATCKTWSPSFFSTVRLASIVAQQVNVTSGKFEPVDTYTMTQTMPKPEDGTSATLWLASVGHTGHDATSGVGVVDPITLPTVSFASIKLPNRTATVDGIPVFNRHRLAAVTTETGSVISASYELPKACGSTNGLVPASNTNSCYPVRWTPEGHTEPIVDWFNKYAVTRVTATDPTGGAAATSTSYKYIGGAAWHYDDNETVKAKNRTYGQFRGYGTVQTFTGDGENDRRTQAQTTYYRGMSKNNNTTVVNVTDSLGGVHEDLPELAGQTLETTAYQGEGGAIDSSKINAYWVSEATATRARTGVPDLTAKTVQPALVLSRQRVTSSGSTKWRQTQTDNSYDAAVTSPTFGLLKAVYSHTVPADPKYDRCAVTTYAKPNIGKNLVGLVSQSESLAVACGGFTQHTPASVPSGLNTLATPTSVSRPAQVIALTRTFYDDTDWSTTFPQAAAPSTGDVTLTQSAKDHVAGAYVLQTDSRSTYDQYGRAVDAYDANGNKTKTTYAMNSVGLATGLTITNPLEQTTSATLRPARGLTVASSDVNSIVTRQAYDALGRRTAVWLNSRATTSPANAKFTYTVSKTGVSASTTETTNDANGYLRSVTLYDAQLRVRQTQSVTPQGGRLVTDTFYDTHGWTSASYNGWWDPKTTPAVGAPVGAADLKLKVPNQTFTTYDGLGRAVVAEQAKHGVTVERSTTVYGGDRTTVVPPQGGTTTTTVIDPAGRTVALDQYKIAPAVVQPADTFTGTFGISGGTAISTTYGYDSRGKQSTVTDTDGNTWTSASNLLGQITAKSDPDAGDSSDFSYDGNGNLLQSTDGRGKTTSTTYDALGRPTGTYTAATAGQSDASRLSKLEYDNANNAVANMPFPLGHLTTATSYLGGEVFRTQAKGFNAFGSSTGETVTIPSTEGALAGDYIFTRVYTANNGLLLKEILPGKGGLPAETVLHGYDGFDFPNTLGGLHGYAQGVTQDAYGRVNYATIGSGANQATISNAYDEHTGRLLQQQINRTATTPKTIDQQDYTYDLTGNLIRQISSRPAAGTGETQCFGYDALARLTEAWTATDTCDVSPTAASHGMVGNTIGAGSAYWTSWAFDDVGNRTGQIEHAVSGGADTTTTYAHDGNGKEQPHTLTSTSTTGAATDNSTFGYDAAGALITRDSDAGDQTLTWNDLGKLNTVTTADGTSTSIYGADGNLLLQKDPGSTVLYLAGQQHTLNTATQVVTGVRYYALPGGGSVIRTGSGTNYSFAIADGHATPSLYLDSTAQTPTWRMFTPYGEARGTAGLFPDNRGFLNAPENKSTGLTHLGAREYDPDLGRFISVDPLQDLADPQQWNGYSYANNNPTTLSDPSGLRPECGTGYGSSTCDNSAPVAKKSRKKGKSQGWSDNNTKNKSPGFSNRYGRNGTKSTTDVVGRKFINDEVLPEGGPDLNRLAADVDKLRGENPWGFCDFTCKYDTWNLIFVACQVGAQKCSDDWWGEVGEIRTTEMCAVMPCDGVPVGGAEAGLLRAVDSGLSDAASTGTKSSRYAANFCSGNSFSPQTLVLMADGSTKPIADIKTGDEVLATDPESDRTEGREVLATLVNDDTHFTDLLVQAADGGRATVETTQEHPFWDESQKLWRNAGDLGDEARLLSLDGETVSVVETRSHQGRRFMYNLTVADIHTFYVLAGTTPVLVHNCGGARKYPIEQLRDKFKHAADFGVYGNKNDRNQAMFSAALEAHIKDPYTVKIDGTYHKQPATHYLNLRDGTNSMYDPQGNWISGWKLNDQQFNNVSMRGSL